ncbi:MAG: N-acyl homoserine lactonase family protein [Sneathiella sp.]
MIRIISIIHTSILIFFAAYYTSTALASSSASDLKLYRLDCGRVHVDPKDVFSDTDEFPKQTQDLVSSCYLIKHDTQWLLWDTGLPSGIAESPNGVQNGPFHLSVNTLLISQLAKLNLTPEDIDYVGLSHGHFDHTGNVNLFRDAQLIIQKAEYDFYATPDLARAYHMEPKLIDYFLTGKGRENVRKLEGDADIFGDGSVTALSLPGHTPGHMALKVILPETGPVFLSGDQWHFTGNRTKNGVPDFNYNRADTLTSSKRLNRLIENTNGLLIIQHEPVHNGALPLLPNYLK